jgi:hypothetical protein
MEMNMELWWNGVDRENDGRTKCKKRTYKN